MLLLNIGNHSPGQPNNVERRKEALYLLKKMHNLSEEVEKEINYAEKFFRKTE